MATPLVIFGTGGSGTRAVARVVAQAEYFLGGHLNDSADSLDLAEFLERRINWFLARVPWIDEMLRGCEIAKRLEGGWDAGAMVEEFRGAIARHREGIPDREHRWGWKNPRTIFVLPFVHGQYPGMRALHVVRDGRDMAYSANQNQLTKHGPWVLEEVEGRGSEPVRAMILWSRVNLATARYGERHLPGRYLRVRFEELCGDPDGIVERIFEFLGCRVAREIHRAAVDELKSPPSLGRWRTKSAAEIRHLTAVGEVALRELGYG